MPQQVITCATNKDRHPGAPDLPVPRRSSKVVQAERAAQDMAAMAVKKQQVEQTRKVAEIEDQLQRTTDEELTTFKNPTANMPEKVPTPARRPNDPTQKTTAQTTGNELFIPKNKTTYFLVL